MSKKLKGKAKANARKKARKAKMKGYKDTITLISPSGNRQIKRPKGIPSFIDSYMEIG